MKDEPNPSDELLLDTETLRRELQSQGYSVIPRLLTPAACDRVREWFDDPAHFRSIVIMQRHGFGRGLYKYFAYPLPVEVWRVRRRLYSVLAEIANEWAKMLGIETRYPDRIEAFHRRCVLAGQTLPTPLILKYGPGDYNCLHQDLYGDTAFPLQAAILLSPRGDFGGGEFILTEQRPRMQSRAQVVSLDQGDAVIFPVNERPVRGTRGHYRVRHKHGVSTVTNGERMTLGIIFHDAAPGRSQPFPAN